MFITSANGEKLPVHSQGDVKVKIGPKKTLLMRKVLYVPSLKSNLVSVSALTKNNFTVTFESDSCNITNNNNEVLATGSKITNAVYKLDTSIRKTVCNTTVALGEEVSNSIDVWHCRMGHLNPDYLRILKNGSAAGINFSDGSNITQCVSCAKGKHVKQPFRASSSRAKSRLALIHSDVCQLPVPSLSGHKYFVTFLDDYSRKAFVYFMKSKNQVFDIFVLFKNRVENQYNAKIKCLRSNNGGEFMSNDMLN